MNPATDSSRFGGDPEAPEADAFEQSSPVEDADEQEDDGAVGTARSTRLPLHDPEAPEADALEQWEPAPLDEDDRR